MSLRISTAVAALGCALATTASFHSPDAARADSPTVSAPPPARPAAYGVNIAANTDWSVDQAWVDVRNLFRRWGRLGKPWEENPSLPLSDDGYPLDDASSLTYLKGYPDGTYHLRFRGSATVTFSGMGRLAGPVVSANGVSTGDVIVDHRRGELLILNVRGVDVIDPIRDLRLIRPDLPPETTEVFSERFLHRLRPFSVVRFMDWTRTNNSQVRDWSGRVVPTSFLRTGPGGVAYEDVVALANALKKDVWINVPDEATGEFVVQLARLLRDTLDPDLAVYVEYSNEVWNSTFAQAKRLSASAMTNPHLTKPDAFGRAGELAAERLVSIATIFRSEFGGQAGRVRPVLCGIIANTYFLECGLAYTRARHGDPSHLFYAIAVAPYLSLDPAIDRPGLTNDGLLSSLATFLRNTVADWIRRHHDLSTRYGLPLMAYEGGQHLVAWNSADRREVNEPLKRSVQDDPRMGLLYRELDATWRRAGGELFTYYTFASPYGKSGYWGLLADCASAGSVKWDAVLGVMLPAGDATLDGVVNFSDFETLRANFGRPAAWWEQGDFNRDGLVDATDLATLNANLRDLTPDQEAAVREFARDPGPFPPR